MMKKDVCNVMEQKVSREDMISVSLSTLARTLLQNLKESSALTKMVLLTKRHVILRGKYMYGVMRSFKTATKKLVTL
jgi:hypothetical protein